MESRDEVVNIFFLFNLCLLHLSYLSAFKHDYFERFFIKMEHNGRNYCKLSFFKLDMYTIALCTYQINQIVFI